MKLHLKFALMVALFLVTTLGAYLAIEPSTTAWTAAGDLARTKRFGFGPRGVAAQISEDEKRFFTILQSPKSHLVFREVYDVGTNEAKAYAIVGLKQTFLGRGDERIEEFARSPVSYSSQGGCIVTEGNAAKDLVAALASDSLQHYIRDQR